MDTHDWLPNQALHFNAVRCIECHAQTHDSILVSHYIKPKEEAVQNCVDCHSENSILLASLYKYQVSEKRSQLGFINAPLIEEDYYVIGANRNYFLNVASVVIFLMVIAGIGIHLVLRMRSKKN